MLSGRPLNADKPCGKAIFFRMRRLDPPLFKILLHIAKSSLFCESADGTGPKYVIGAKQNFRIFMCLCLVLSGEIQVDIRSFFITGKSKKSLKRDIEAFSAKPCSANRAFFLRHVSSAAIGSSLVHSQF